MDERICDSYYYGTTIRSFRKLMRNPEMLLTPPEQVFEDPGLPPAKGGQRSAKARRSSSNQKKKAGQKEAKAQRKPPRVISPVLQRFPVRRVFPCAGFFTSRCFRLDTHQHKYYNLYVPALKTQDIVYKKK